MNRQSTYRRGQSDSEFCILHSEFRRLRRAYTACLFRRQGGYTMAELLIVVIIMIMLVAATLPVAKKVMDDSQVREASRALNSYFQMAKSKAIQTGRPCGLYLDCTTPPLGRSLADDEQPAAPNNFNPAVVRAVTELHLAEVPAPYSGSLIGSVAKAASAGGIYYFAPWDPNTNQPDQNEATQLAALLNRNGETFQVRFDSKGEWHNFRYDPQAQFPNQFPQTLPSTSAVNPPTIRPVAFQVRRAPHKTGQPLALPTGTCIDMRYSGVGPTVDRFPAQPSKDLIILFTPNGGVDSLVVTTQVQNPPNPPTFTVSNVTPLGTLYFLIGKVDKVNDPNNVRFDDIRDSNLADPTSLWVTVGRGNGQVTTSENMPDPNVNPMTLGNYLRAARQVATSREQMRGR